MASTPNWTATPKVGLANIAAANTNRDGTGTIGTVFTAAASGSRVDVITVQARATTTAGMIRLYVHDGTTAFLFREIVVPAIVPAAAVQAFNVSLTIEGGLSLPVNYSLRASTNNAESFNVMAQGGDF